MEKKSNGFSIASMVLGIIGLLLSCLFIGVIPAIIGLIFGILALANNQTKGMSIAGIVCSSIGIIIFLFSFIIALGKNSNSLERDKNNDLIEQYESTQLEDNKENSLIAETDLSTEIAPMESPSQQEPDKTEMLQDILSEGIEKYNSGEYLFITTVDLNKYAPNMGGVKVFTVIDIDDIKSNMIQSTLSDGFMMSGFNVGSRFDTYKSLFKTGDIVAILGEIEKTTDYSFFGHSISLSDCYVFSYSDDATEYNLAESDSRLSDYFVTTEAVAESGVELSESEYKEICKTLSYEDILRNPDSNKGKYCVVSGKVKQVISGLFGTFTFVIEDSNGNSWYTTYYYKANESHLLEGDKVNVYGKCKGTDAVTTLLGKQVTMPYISLEYIELK